MENQGELKMADTKHQQETDELRRAMGTLPELNVENKETKIHVGVEGISAELIDGPRNPYRTIVEVATATWGNEVFTNKWENITPENRFKIAKAALSGATLPQAVEPILFVFTIRGVSRSAADQHFRARLQTFFSQGCRDNSRLDAGFRLPSELAPENGGDPVLFSDIVAHIAAFKDLYQRILKTGWGSFQTARCLFPLGATHNYRFASNLGALKGYMAQRLKACEQADTCYTAICIWNEINDRWPLIADHLRPGCDWIKKCDYHQSSTLSELFSALFAGCGRWEDPVKYATFNKSCSSYEQMEKEGGKRIPGPTAWKNYTEYAQLSDSDKALFNEETK